MVKGLNPEPAPIAVRQSLPGLAILALSAVVLVPSDQGQMARLSGVLTVIYVFHLTLFRPEGARWPVIVGLGLLTDLWSEALVGLTPLLLLIFQTMVQTLRDDIVSLSFGWRWLMFMLLSGVFFASFGAVTALVLSIPGQHIDLLGRWAVCAGLYPVLVLGLSLLDRYVLYPRRKA